MFLSLDQMKQWRFGRAAPQTTKMSVILELPTDIKHKLSQIQDELVGQLEHVSYQGKGFHVTLVLAEKIPTDKVEETTAKLKALLTNFRLKLEIGPVSALSNPKYAGVVYLEIKNDELEQLHHKTRAILEAAGGTIPFEFKGHVTLAFLSKPAPADLKTLVDEVKETAELGPSHVNISINHSDDNKKWERVALFGLSKRWN